jgi:hypothetical protein
LCGGVVCLLGGGGGWGGGGGGRPPPIARHVEDTRFSVRDTCSVRGRAYVCLRVCVRALSCGDGEHMRGAGLKRTPRSGARNNVASES